MQLGPELPRAVRQARDAGGNRKGQESFLDECSSMMRQPRVLVHERRRVLPGDCAAPQRLERPGMMIDQERRVLHEAVCRPLRDAQQARNFCCRGEIGDIRLPSRGRSCPLTRPRGGGKGVIQQAVLEELPQLFGRDGDLRIDPSFLGAQGDHPSGNSLEFLRLLRIRSHASIVTFTTDNSAAAGPIRKSR